MKRILFIFLALLLAAWQSRARRKVAAEQEAPDTVGCLFGSEWTVNEWDDRR